MKTKQNVNEPLPASGLFCLGAGLAMLHPSQVSAKNETIAGGICDFCDFEAFERGATSWEIPVSASCISCGFFASVMRRTMERGWEYAEWGECRKADLTKTGLLTPILHVCEDWTPIPRVKPNAEAVAAAGKKPTTIEGGQA